MIEQKVVEKRIVAVIAIIEDGTVSMEIIDKDYFFVIMESLIEYTKKLHSDVRGWMKDGKIDFSKQKRLKRFI